MKNLKLKNTVRVNGRHFDPEIRKMLDVARETAPDLHDQTVWVTSANDSGHMRGSKHYTNEAFDIRTRNVNGGHAECVAWRDSMKEGLGADYDVILEKDHIHVEFDPK